LNIDFLDIWFFNDNKFTARWERRRMPLFPMTGCNGVMPPINMESLRKKTDEPRLFCGLAKHVILQSEARNMLKETAKNDHTKVLRVCNACGKKC